MQQHHDLVCSQSSSDNIRLSHHIEVGETPYGWVIKHASRVGENIGHDDHLQERKLRRMRG